MPIKRFPDPRKAIYDGIVYIGGDLHPDSLLLAYRQGIFPWPVRGLPITWVCPNNRAVLRFDRLHIPRSLAKERARSSFHITFNTAFREVILRCAKIDRPERGGTWITPPMVEGYIRFHELGYAHSVEVWDGEELVGGLYGVEVDGVFAGESMFHKRSNTSKFALLHLIDHLRSRGFEWIDIQMMTPHFEILGAELLPRDEFLELVAATRTLGNSIFDRTEPPAGAPALPPTENNSRGSHDQRENLSWRDSLLP